MSYTLKKVSLPFQRDLSVRTGSTITVKGKVKGSCERFHINLECDCEPGGNIAFHFNPRQSQNEVVRNTLCDGSWGSEERDQPYFPFNPKERFEIQIVVLDDCYRVYVNEDRFVDYNHRLPCCDVNTLTIDGDIKVSELSVHDKMQVPYDGLIPGGLNVGKSIVVRGVVRNDPNRFDINFLSLNDDNHVFHFNPRFEEGIVLNSMFDGSWGDEERPERDFPFVSGEMFVATFYILEDSFRVFVNGQYYVDYRYRCPFEEAARLSVNGDVELVAIQYFDALADDVYEPIGKGLKCCDSICLKGVVKPGADRFDFNLREKSSEDTDSPSSSDEELSPEPNISLHFNPRESESEVVKNTLERSDWGGEERDSLPKAFEQGEAFDVRIVVHDANYQIFVNGEHFADYSHRLPFKRVKFVQFHGDAWFHDLQIDRYKELPRIIDVPGDNLRVGQWFIITGLVKPDADRFHFNLMNGSTEQIMFHFNPRFPEGVVVRNTCMDGWEEEEREEPCFPFQPGHLFEVVVQVTDEEFRTFVDGRHFLNFSHRHPFSEVSQLMLDGDAIFFKPQFL